ncbi:MAG: hypothetical protein RI996_624 [Candidatus Parcubacteria bacterium]|jgi:ComF family protein
MLQQIKYIYTKLVDTFFPDTCLGCGLVGVTICDSCLARRQKSSESTYSTLPDYIHPIYSYKDPIIKKLIWSLKYKNKKNIAADISSPLFDTLLGIVIDLRNYHGAKHIYIVPIPLHKSRLADRGYNQSELVAYQLALLGSAYGIELHTNILKRTRSSTPNAKSDSKQMRIKNIKGSFVVSQSAFVSKAHIILVDDVVTTGTTLAEARSVLLAAGALGVSAITIAH